MAAQLTMVMPTRRGPSRRRRRRMYLTMDGDSPPGRPGGAGGGSRLDEDDGEVPEGAPEGGEVDVPELVADGHVGVGDGRVDDRDLLGDDLLVLEVVVPPPVLVHRGGRQVEVAVHLGLPPGRGV